MEGSAAIGASATAAKSSMASASALQHLVEPLKLEAAGRIGASQAAAELQQYRLQNACKDALLVGVPAAGSSPFREPRSCAFL